MVLAEQIKTILLITFISSFISFTYVQFILEPLYVSSAKILLPENKNSNSRGLSGIASQFGVDLSGSSDIDLSSPSLFPDLIKSRIFAERILPMKFFSQEHNKNLPLINILNSNSSDQLLEDNESVQKASAKLQSMISFETDGSFTTLNVKSEDPVFSKKLNEVILDELQKLNRIFKSRSTSEKIEFINNRIDAVSKELNFSEKALKQFREKNRQITSSPSLMLKEEKLSSDVEIQKGIYITLKQQLELSKIEEIQVASIVQILDYPDSPIYPINKNVKLSLVLGFFVGLLFSIPLSFFRAYLNSDNVLHKRKIKKTKNFLKKKLKELFLDNRFTGTLGVVLLIFSPIYFGYKSKNPTFFGMYSNKLMAINILYIIFFITLLFFYIKSKKEKNAIKNNRKH
tara:strand:- start:306 stop:1508 length:1203 start_codon:yes stop_codon:yes gene_type:complete